MIGEIVCWMVVHEDTHGNRDLIKSKLSEVEANALMAQYAKDYQHKQEYYKFSYTASTSKKVMLRERVRE